MLAGGKLMRGKGEASDAAGEAGNMGGARGNVGVEKLECVKGRGGELCRARLESVW